MSFLSARKKRPLKRSREIVRDTTLLVIATEGAVTVMTSFG